MRAETFRNLVNLKTNIDYGKCPPSIKAQEALNILTNHFLGEDWYIVTPMHTEQVNVEAVYEILQKYPMWRDKKEKIKEKLIGFINKYF